MASAMKKHTFTFNYSEFDCLDVQLFLCSEVFKLGSLQEGGETGAVGGHSAELKFISCGA